MCATCNHPAPQDAAPPLYRECLRKRCPHLGAPTGRTHKKDCDKPNCRTAEHECDLHRFCTPLAVSIEHPLIMACVNCPDSPRG